MGGVVFVFHFWFFCYRPRIQSTYDEFSTRMRCFAMFFFSTLVVCFMQPKWLRTCYLKSVCWCWSYEARLLIYPKATEQNVFSHFLGFLREILNVGPHWDFWGADGSEAFYLCCRWTHSSQSTATRRLMSWVGSPTAVRIRSMVTSPALGILAAPTLARVAVMLKRASKFHSQQEDRERCD